MVAIHFRASIFYYPNCIFCVHIIGDVRITEGPADLCVGLGEIATFSCHYEGTKIFPYWKIGTARYTALYTTLSLPRHHHYNFLKQELVVRYTKPINYHCRYQVAIPTTWNHVLQLLPLIICFFITEMLKTT